jgi:hypothetical protein
MGKGREEGEEGGEGEGDAREAVCGDDWIKQQLHGEVPAC